MHTLVYDLVLSRKSNTSDIFVVGQTQKGWAFRIQCVLLVWSQFTVVPLGKKFTRTTPFLCQNTVTMIFPANSTLLTSSLGQSRGAIPWLPLGFRLKLWTQVSSPVTICNNQPSPQVSYLCNTSVVTAFFLSLCTCHHLWHPMSADLGIASSAITAITLPLPMDRVEYSSSVVVGQSLHIIPPTQQMWAISAVEVRPLRSLWWSAAPPVSASLIHLPSPNSTHIHSSITIHLQQMLMNSRWLLTYSNQSPTTVCFIWVSISATLESSSAATCQANSCN